MAKAMHSTMVEASPCTETAGFTTCCSGRILDQNAADGGMQTSAEFLGQIQALVLTVGAVGVRVECGAAVLPEEVEPPLLHLGG